MNSNIDLQNSTTKVIPKPIPIENSKPTPILKKCVWRPVLDSALVVPWPTMSQDVAEKVLKSVSSILWNFTSHLNSLESKQDAPCKRKTKRKRSHTRCLDDTPSHDLPNTPDTIAMETDIVIETNDGRGVSRPPATRPHDMDALSQTNRVPDITDQMIITSQPTDSKLSMDPTPPMEVNLSDTAIPDPIPIPAIETSTCATDLADGLCTVVGRAKAQDQVIVGIKVITQMLESRIRELQSSTYQSTSKRPIPETTNGSIESNDPPCKGQYIFVCRDDLNPISVVDHLPPMIASLNRMLLLYKSSSSADTIIQSSTCYLVPLPRGSTTKLSLALGIKRTAAVAISVSRFSLGYLNDTEESFFFVSGFYVGIHQLDWFDSWFTQATISAFFKSPHPN
ncbi:hypothetical protein DFH28DRAFT_886674 [Melampsora americana]|nr:hypothetical protein DFH28DRAFT_886674 [Melampsora americana]